MEDTLEAKSLKGVCVCVRVLSSTYLHPCNIEFTLYIHVGGDTFFSVVGKFLYLYAWLLYYKAPYLSITNIY